MIELEALEGLRSRPTRARGLKHLNAMLRCWSLAVAPHAGAWIETWGKNGGTQDDGVAPHAGAWIETRARCPFLQACRRRAPRGRVD